MRKRHHPTDDDLLDLLDSPAEATEERTQIDAHVKECSLCTTRLGDLREFVAVLREADVWDRRELKVAPRHEWMRLVSSVVQQLRDEETDAAKLIGQVLTGPSKWWRTRALASDQTRTYGFVKKLLELADTLLNNSPADSLELTEIAVEIAGELHIHSYPFDLVISSRAHAWREHAYSLFFLGRFPEAVLAIDRAEQLFGQLPVPQFDLARTSLIRAAIYRSTDRVAEAIPLARTAASYFLSFGDRTRHVKARMTEAAMLHERGSIPEALAVWKSLEDEPTLRDDPDFGMLLQNIGTSYAQLGRHDEARQYLTRAIEEHQRHGNEPEIVRTRWSLGTALVASGELHAALPLLRQAWREFDALQMTGSSALVALEVAEVLLVMGQPEQVPAICRMLLDQFTQTGRTSRAITALSFLREAVALGKATPSLVQHVRDFIRDIPNNPARTFKPPSL